MILLKGFDHIVYFLNHGHLHSGQLSCHFFSDKWQAWIGTQITPCVGFFGSWLFIILKNSHQGLSNEGSTFILSSLGVDHWFAQTWPFFDKLLEITVFGPLHQSQSRARFWICSVFTKGIVNVKISQALTFFMPKKVFSKSFTKIEWVCVTLLGFQCRNKTIQKLS